MATEKNTKKSRSRKCWEHWAIVENHLTRLSCAADEIGCSKRNNRAPLVINHHVIKAATMMVGGGVVSSIVSTVYLFVMSFCRFNNLKLCRCRTESMTALTSLPRIRNPRQVSCCRDTNRLRVFLSSYSAADDLRLISLQDPLIAFDVFSKQSDDKITFYMR